ncbi:MAG: CARDB domain-containing protein [Solirubrobacterales bacterium]
MAFLDDDDPLEPEDLGQSRRYGAPRQRPFLARRLGALVGGVLVIILLVLGVRGCLDARKERGFENYARDLASIATESEQLSKEFFGRLRDPGELTELSLKAEVDADEGTAENLLERVAGLDTPDELADAQSELELAFELRRDGIGGVADEIDTALAKEGAEEATDRIANYMRYFLASDVLYGRSKGAIENELANQDIVPDENLSKAPFLPDPPEDWINAGNLAGSISGVTTGGGGGECSGVCGIALLETSAGGTVLTPGGLTNVGGGAPYELEIQVQNQGESEITDVAVDFTLSGAETIEGAGTIDRIDVGATESAKLNIQPDPEPGAELTLEVTAQPVEGEEIEDNNTATYTVTFE